MRALLRSAVAASLVAVVPAAQGQTPATEPSGRIVGRMVAAGSGRPLPGVMVTLHADSADPIERSLQPTVVTREDGKFEFKGLSAGYYSFFCFKAGYGRNREPTYNTYLREDEVIADLLIELTPPGAITGLVLDPEGRPVPGVDVGAERIETIFSYVRLQVSKSVKTDEEGRYRIFGLSAGRYFVRAEPSDTARTPLFSPTYYPATTEFSGASRVRIDWGGEAGGIDIRLLPVAPTVVEGLLAHGESSTPCAKCTVEVMQMAGPYRRKPKRIRTGADGAFRLEGLVPGPYYFLAETDEPKRFALSKVHVASDRLTSVALRLVPGVTVSGRVRMENRGPEEKETISSPAPYAALSTLHPGFGGGGEEQADKQGVFSMTVPPDRYKLSSNCGAQDGYLVEAFVEGQRLPDRYLEVLEGVPVKHLEMVCSSGKAKLLLLVKPSAGAPPFDRLPGVDVWYRPDESVSRYLDDGYFGVTGAGGAPIEVNRFPPGRYTLYALSNLLNIEWTDREVLKVLEPYGVDVDFKAGEATKVELVFVPSSIRLP